MNKSGSGIGSASIVLIFAVLCMTVFALISFSSALADKALANAQEKLVKEYYAADARAEYILAEITRTGKIPAEIGGVAITTRPAENAVTAAFACSMSDSKELRVEVNVYENSFEILKWKVQDTGTWTADDSINVLRTKQ